MIPAMVEPRYMNILANADTVPRAVVVNDCNRPMNTGKIVPPRKKVPDRIAAAATMPALKGSAR